MSVKPLPDDHPTWPRHAKTGLLLVNLGTPDATDKTSDAAVSETVFIRCPVIEVPRLLWWLILNLIILNVRPKKSGAAYDKIWLKMIRMAAITQIYTPSGRDAERDDGRGDLMVDQGHALWSALHSQTGWRYCAKQAAIAL